MTCYEMHTMQVRKGPQPVSERLLSAASRSQQTPLPTPIENNQREFQPSFVFSLFFFTYIYIHRRCRLLVLSTFKNMLKSLLICEFVLHPFLFLTVYLSGPFELQFCRVCIVLIVFSSRSSQFSAKLATCSPVKSILQQCWRWCLV